MAITSESALPDRIADVEQLEELLSRPSAAALETIAALEGDILILGVGGKMGPTLARMIRRAVDECGTRRRVIGASRYSEPGLAERLQSWEIETIAADLLDRRQLANLPDAPNIIYMAGMKFGTAAHPSLTWAMNVLLPALVAERYPRSRIAAFSSGNVYPLSKVVYGGARETDPVGPVGEYAMSVVGRERMFEHASATRGTRVSIIRLNYACELRYGVLVDVAVQVLRGESIPVAMGSYNAIWQGDANAMAIASLRDAAAPPFVFNLAGPETLSVRRVAEQFARHFDRTVSFVGDESPDALLSNGQMALGRYGYPRVSIDRLIAWIADWLSRGGQQLGKPTHFEARDGRF